MAATRTDQIFEDIVEAIRDPLLVLDSDLKVILANRSFIDSFEVTREETLGNFIYDLGNKQWDIPRLRELLETILPQKSSFDNYEVEHDFTTIGKRTMLLNARRIEQAMGKERIILLAIEDITERKRLEDLLVDSEERYRRLFETATDGILLLEKSKGNIVRANPAIKEILAYSNNEISGKNLKDIGFPHDMETIQEILQTLERDGIIHYKDFSLKKKNGQFIDTDIYMVDKAILVQCNIRDITERKRAEEELLHSEQNYRNLVENANEAIFVAQDENLVFFNLKTIALTGYSDEELRSRPFIEFIHPDDREMVIDRHVRRLKGEELPHLYPFRVLHKDGSIMWGELNAVLINWDGKPATLNFLSDITERKWAEEALRESEEKYRRIYENSVVGFFQSTPEGRFLHVNPAFAKMLGYGSPEEFVSSVTDIASQAYANPEDRSRYHKALETNGYVEDFELKVRCKEGSEVWLSDSSRAEFDEDGRIVRYEGIVVDITDRKRAEEELYKIEAMTKALLHGIPESAFLIESDGTIIAANTTVAQRLNCPMEDLIGSNIYTRVSHEVSEFRRKFLDQAVQTGKPFQFEDVRSGRNIDNRINPILDQHGKVTRFAIVGIDITERKRAEEALRESEEQFRALIENMAEGIVLKDASDRFVHWNPKASEVFGIEIDELKGQSTESFERQIIHEDGSDFHKNDLPSLYTLRTGEPCENVVMGIKRGPQDTIWIKVNTKPYTKNRDGKPSGVIISFSDITERKKAEEDLRESLQRLEFALQGGKLGMWDWNPQDGAVVYSDLWAQMLEYRPDEVEPTVDFFKQHVHPVSV